MKTTKLFAVLLTGMYCAAYSDSVSADSFGSGLNTFDIEFVSISDPDNPDDTTGSPNPAGAVPYNYRIGKYEVSEQMIEKANTMGGLGITKDTRGVDKPATAVSWNTAARFINWLNTSSNSTPAYKFDLQPGDAGYSVNADIQLWDPDDTGYNPNNLYRNSRAKYFLPSVDEWYKAAYFDATNGVYYNYSTGSNSVPTAVASGTAAGTAVYGQSLNTGPADITLAGGLSPYGTMGQGGNVWEWEETDFDLVNNSSSSARGIRGGSWSLSSGFLHASIRSFEDPSFEDFLVGFRVASIPEPTTVLLGVLASVGLLLRRRR